MTSPHVPTNASEENSRLLTDFTDTTEDFGWFVVNDNVMGGRSDGDFEIRDGQIHFTGITNTRGGGFSSIRTRGPRLDLSNFSGVQLRVKGDGRRYTWQLRTTARFRGRDVSYWADFGTTESTWTTVDLPFSAFVPKFRGMQLQGPPPDPAEIAGMGLMINDGRDGRFDILLDSVHAYAASESFALSDLRWKKRVLVISAPDETNEDLARQLVEIENSAGEFSDRDMTLITMLSDGLSTVDQERIDDDDAAELRERLRMDESAFALRLVGKDGSVKLSSDTPTPMAEIYALIDGMPMRRQEMREP